MDGDVESKQLNKTCVITEAEESCEVVGVILCRIDGWEFTLTENVAVNATSNVGQFSNPTRNVK